MADQGKTKQKLLTSGQVARACGVSFRTVNRWADQGLLQAFHLPGRGDRRFEPKEVIRFCRENDLFLSEGIEKGGSILASQSTFSRTRILIVDDEENVCRSIQRALQGLNAEFRYATNGLEAGVALTEFLPHLVTLDLRMPGFSGQDFLRAIKSTSHSFKTLVVSGLSKTDLELSLENGAEAYLEKPFSNDELNKTVQQLIRHQS